MTSAIQTTFIPLILLVIAAFANALMIVFTNYLESLGAEWYQVLLAEYWVNLILVLWFWVLSFAYNYYYTDDRQISTQYEYDSYDDIEDQVHDDDSSQQPNDQSLISNTNQTDATSTTGTGLSATSNLNPNPNSLALAQQSQSPQRQTRPRSASNSVSIATSAEKDIHDNHDTFLSYLLSVFPPIDDEHIKHWCVLFVRSVCSLGSFAFLDIALDCLDSGDAMLIQTVLVTLLNFLLGYVVFSERINRIIAFALILCIVGLVLVVQPDFLFSKTGDADSGTQYDQISMLGFALIAGAALLRALSTTLVKYTRDIQLSHTTVVVVPQIIMSLILVVFYIYGVCSSEADWNANIFYVANGSKSMERLNTFLLVLLGILFFVWILTAVIGYRLGNIGRLGIVQNSDIVIAYVIEAWFFNETQNYICYIGVTLTLIGCVVVFYEQRWSFYNEMDGMDMDIQSVISGSSTEIESNTGDVEGGTEQNNRNVYGRQSPSGDSGRLNHGGYSTTDNENETDEQYEFDDGNYTSEYKHKYQALG